MKKVKSIIIIFFCIFILLSCKDSGDGSDDVEISAQLIEVGTLYDDVAITAFGTKFYKFTAAGDGAHRIWLTELESDMGWTLFTNPDPFNPNIIDELDDNIDNSDETGSTVALIEDETYYLAIDEWDEVSSEFDLQVTFP